MLEIEDCWRLRLKIRNIIKTIEILYHVNYIDKIVNYKNIKKEIRIVMLTIFVIKMLTSTCYIKKKIDV